MSKQKRSLGEYEQKRDFEISSEPAGAEAIHPGGRTFVVQKHLARHLHYDFRMEIDGVLRSWAVPKGPSLDPSVKRMAIQVEDHPLDYARFEGVIPEGQYGAGKIIVWDLGEWSPMQGQDHGWERGNFKFALHGEKLRGRWALVRLAPPKKREWLLIKERDGFARSESDFVVTNQSPRSVLTGRDVHEITGLPQLRSQPKVTSGAGGHNRRGNSESRTTVNQRSAERQSLASDPSGLSQARQSALPREITPQLATTTEQTPAGPDWLHEIKLDGYRILAAKTGSQVRLQTRNALDWTDRFPSIAAAVKQVAGEALVLDGELVRLRSDGVSDFAALQSSLRDGEEDQLVYFVFDLLYADGFSLREVPLLERKALLAERLSTVANSRIQYCDHVLGRGPEFFEQCRQAGLEGVISKRIQSRYQSGRSDSWLKHKCLFLDDFIVVGYMRSENRPGALRSLLLAYREDGQLRYAGKVGSGFSEQMLEDLRHQCDQRRVSQLENIRLPADLDRRRIVWCNPDLVVRIHFVGWTRSGQLRHPAFVGLRSDTDASQMTEPVRHQRTQAIGQSTHKPPTVEHVTPEQLNELSSVHLSNPDKVLYPSTQATKLDVAKYYVGVARWMLPYIRHRPLSLVRFPDGIEQASFFQKHPKDGTPRGIETIPDDESKKHLLGISKLLGLMSAVQLAALEFHVWSARRDRLDRPDRIIFDFDPAPSVSWESVREAAEECRQLLDQSGLQGFVKTSGGRGIHVVVPILRRSSWSDVLRYAKALAHRMQAAAPEKYTTGMSKEMRHHKILIDVHRNHRGATCVAAYSLRARPLATVSTPLDWTDLKAIDNPHEFDLATVSRLVGTRTHDPWAEFYHLKQALTRSKIEQLS